jgi:peptidoglycan/xylan/chitin deacetylase (PgdA/CDA1 family)
VTGRVSAAGERRVEGGAERSEGPASKRSVALKVDCDTLEGTLEGVPRLLEIFAARGIRATFYFTLGPDRSGVAVRRVFTQRGFLAKMIRSRAPSLYVGWHDRLRSMTREEIARAYGAAHAEFLRIFGVPARSSAAPGWAADARSLEVESERPLLHTSDTRGGAPFFPKAGERTLPTLEIPTTLPTLDEMLAWPSLRGDAAQRAFYRGSVRGTEVHTVHTEVEGRSKAALFEGILDDWRADGVGFPTLAELAREALEKRERIPARTVAWTRLPGRAGEVATGWLETAA